MTDTEAMRAAHIVLTAISTHPTLDLSEGLGLVAEGEKR